MDLISRVPGWYAALMAMIFGGEKYLEGPYGRVAISTLENVRNTPLVTLYSNISRVLDITTKLSTSTSQALAGVGARANMIQYTLQVPQGVLYELQSARLLNVSQTLEGGVVALEYEFTPAAMPYVEQFVTGIIYP